MKAVWNHLLLSLVIFAAAALPAGARLSLDVESGRVYSGYNDVRIPGDTGTKFSLTEDLSSEPSWFVRARADYLFSERHSISALVAPLRIRASGKYPRPITFRDRIFAANTELDARFRFDSYRLSYRYDFYQTGSFSAGAGITAKVRDASIRVSDASGGAEKSNTGFVPLVNFRAEWAFASPLSALLEGDALAAPQGRAEDILLALQYRAGESVSFKAGYRMLEGGADNDEVYTFSLFHYLVAGMTVFF